MPTRFYLASSGTPAVSPPVSAGWGHTGAGTRYPMSPIKGSSPLAQPNFVYDAADHLVNADAQAVQYISPPLLAQTISAQTVTLTIQALEANAANNLFGAWKIYVWTAAGALGPTLVSLTRGALELNTVLQSRSGAVTSTSVTVGAGDRLVLEIGAGGTPTATGGVQGHNFTLRYGEDGATDCPADDVTTALTVNPWLEFSGTINFPPELAAPTAIRARSAVEQVATRATQSEVGLRGVSRLVTVSTARLRRAFVTWAQLAVPKPLGFDFLSPMRLVAAARSVATARKATAAATRAAARPRVTVAATLGYAAPATLRARTGGTNQTVKVVPGFSEGPIVLRTRTRLGVTAKSLRRAQARLAAAAELVAPEALAQHTAVVDLSALTGGGPAAATRDAQTTLDLRAAPRADLQTFEERSASTTLQAAFSVAMESDGEVSVQLPFNPLAPINLGYVYRGDTLTLPLWRATDRQGNTIDLTGASLWFTAKTSLSESDLEAPTIQVSTADGGVVVLDADDGLYQVTLQPKETRGLTGDTVFTFDVQVVTIHGVTRTVRWGSLVVVRDVTRAVA
jgi:hypothetical protein